MKFNKTIIFLLTFIVATQSANYSVAGGTISIDKKSIDDFQQATDKTIKDNLTAVSEAANIAAENFASKGLSDAGTNLGQGIKDATKEVAPAVNLAANAFAAVQVLSVAKDVVNGVQAVHSYISPSEAQQAADLETRKKLEYLKAERSYSTCMRSNTGPRTSAGFPSSCSVFEQAFAMAGGSKTVDEMKEIFKKYDKSC